MNELVRLSEELFLMCTFVQTILDDINITKIKSQDEKPRDLKQFYNQSRILEMDGNISWDM